MGSFFTERWNRSQYYILGLWGLSLVFLALALITPVGALIGGALLIAGAITAAALSSITIPLFVVKGFQAVHTWFQSLFANTYEQANPIHEPPESAPLLEEPEPFVFDVPATLHEAHEAQDAIFEAQIDHPEGSYTYYSESILDEPMQPLEPALLAHLLQAYRRERASHIALEIAPLHICILGTGPTGLIAALRAYAHGASITAIDKRDKYTRKNVFRLTPEFLIGRPDGSLLPYNLMETIFFRQHISQDVGTRYFDLPGTIVRRFPINLQPIHMDTVFDADDSGLFHTIATNELEHVLFSILNHLQTADPAHIQVYRGHTICGIQADQGLVSLKKGYNFTQLKADWIVNATGANGRLTHGSLIADALFPITNPPSDSPHATYLAATFTSKKWGKGRRAVIHGNRHTVPHGFSLGSSQAIAHHPERAGQIRSRIQSYQLPGTVLAKRNTLHEQSVFFGYRQKAPYLENLSRGDDATGKEIDLACSYYGVLDSLDKMREFGWQRKRLPLIRQLNSGTIIYVGMEIPIALFNQLTSVRLSSREKDNLFQSWLNITFEQFFNSDFIAQLSIEQGSAFSVQMRVSNQIMHRYPSGVQVFNLGDVLSPPHFLTGSGVETAAISVHHWIEYMRHLNESEYIEQIQTKVQHRAISKVNEGLRALSMFSSPTPSETHEASTATPEFL